MIQSQIRQLLPPSSVRLFMPGHKGTLSDYDVTELPGTDNLHFPTGILAEAERTVSKTVGAAHTFFSVNGATAGIHAAILAVCRRGGKILVDRSCHISVVNALILYDVTPVFVYPNMQPPFGISRGISPEGIRWDTDIDAALITSPTYYGVCCDVSSIAKAAREHGVPLIVDAAHGAHFPFCAGLPESAVTAGADIVIHSNHKTLGCLTQGATVHISDRIDAAVMRRCMNMVQTTSPSYLLMAAIERSVREMAEAAGALTALAERCDGVRDALNRSGRYLCADKQSGFFDYDKTRLVIAADDTARLRQVLHDKFSIDIEMEDGRNLVCIPTIYNGEKDLERLTDALLAADAGYTEPPCNPFPQTELVLSPHEAYYGAAETVPPTGAAGRVAARSVYKSPPCMPLLCPGERITAEIAELLTDDIEIVYNM